MKNEKIASEMVKIAKLLLSKDFPTEDALKEYLKEHPNADKSQHKVVETDKTDNKEEQESSGSVEDKVKQKTKSFDTKGAVVKFGQNEEEFKNSFKDLVGNDTENTKQYARHLEESAKHTKKGVNDYMRKMIEKSGMKVPHKDSALAQKTWEIARDESKSEEERKQARHVSLMDSYLENIITLSNEVQEGKLKI